MYSLEIKPELDSKFEKLAKKNEKQFEIIINKTNEILENPVPLQKIQNKHVNIWIMNKRQNIRRECINIIKLSQIIDY